MVQALLRELTFELVIKIWIYSDNNVKTSCHIEFFDRILRFSKD